MKKIIALCLFLVIVGIFIKLIALSKSTSNIVNLEEVSSSIAKSVQINSRDNQDVQDAQESSKCILMVENILQNPELPSGCEITSLAIVLNYLQYNVDKEELAQHYLNTSTSSTTNLYEAFRGNPEDNTGFGCYSPVITQAANDYLADMGSVQKAYDLSGSDLYELFIQIDKGNPVIVWGSTDIDSEIIFDYSWVADGQTMVWSSLQHCMVLIGYDLEGEVVYVANPLSGIMEYDLESFNERYTEYFSQAVVVY